MDRGRPRSLRHLGAFLVPFSPRSGEVTGVQGAERGLLILLRGRDHRIEAEAWTSGDTVAVRLQHATVGPAVLPESVFQYVMRTQENVILDEAALQSPFSEDIYIRQRRARSIICFTRDTRSQPNRVTKALRVPRGRGSFAGVRDSRGLTLLHFRVPAETSLFAALHKCTRFELGPAMIPPKMVDDSTFNAYVAEGTS